MSAWVIAKREMNEKRLVLVLGPFGLLAAWVVPHFMGLQISANADSYSVAFLGVAIASVWSLAAFLGAGMIARDLEERRFAFYLSRPVSEGAILGGKLLAGLILSMACGLMILLPLFLGFSKIGLGTVLGLCGFLLLGALFLMLFFHAAAVMVRSRTAWVLLDLTVMSGFGIVATVCVQTLTQQGALQSVHGLFIGFFVAFLVVLALAATIQVTRGRGDLRRGHRFLTMTVAVGLGTSCLLGGFYTLWVLNPGPSNLVSAEVLDASSQGDWIAVSGRGHWRGDYHTSYLLNVTTGKYWKVDSPYIQVSADGSRAMWWEQAGVGVWTVDLIRHDFRPQRMELEAHSFYSSTCCLTPDGKRLVVATTHELQIYDLSTGQQMVSKDYFGDSSVRMDLLSSNRLRVYGKDPQGEKLEIQEMDLLTGQLSTTSCIQETAPGTRYLSAGSRNPRADRILVRGENAAGVFLNLCDVGTGRTIRHLVAGKTRNDNVRAIFLEDGRILFTEIIANHVQMHFLDANGKELDFWELDLAPFAIGKPGERRWASVWGTPKPDFLYLSIGSGDHHEAILELEPTRRSVHRIYGLTPVRGWNPFQGGVVLRPRLFKRDDGSLVLREKDGRLRRLTHAG